MSSGSASLAASLVKLLAKGTFVLRFTEYWSVTRAHEANVRVELDTVSNSSEQSGQDHLDCIIPESGGCKMKVKVVISPQVVTIHTQPKEPNPDEKLDLFHRFF